MHRCLRSACVAARRFHTSRVTAKAFEMPVPSMGDSITEGTLLKVLKQPGEQVALDEVLAVIETDKV